MVGLQPGALYNVTVTTVSPDDREGPPTSQLFWTEVGKPLPPPKPTVRVADGGRMYVRFKPLSGNPARFHKSSLSDLKLDLDHICN